MALTPVKLTGFEWGTSTLTANGGGLCDTVTGSPTVSSSYKRTGTYSLRIYAASAAATNIIFTTTTIGSSKNVMIGSAYIMFHTWPNGNVEIFTATVGAVYPSIYFDNTNKKIMSTAGGSAQTNGVTIALDTWYRIDWKINVSANPWTVDVQVEGTASTQATNGVAGSTFTNAIIGWRTAYTGEMYVDDYILSTTSTDTYPIGQHFIIGLSPANKGYMHSNNPSGYLQDNYSSVIDDSGTVACGSLDEIPFGTTTDYIKQTAIASGEYAETQFASCPGGTVIGVQFLLGYTSSATTANSASTRIRDGEGTETVVFTGDMSETSTFYKFKIIPPPSIFGRWSSDAVSTLKARMGYATSVGSLPRWQTMMLEVAMTGYGGGTSGSGYQICESWNEPIAVCETSSGVFYALCYDGQFMDYGVVLYKSTDFGHTWIRFLEADSTKIWGTAGVGTTARMVTDGNNIAIFACRNANSADCIKYCNGGGPTADWETIFTSGSNGMSTIAMGVGIDSSYYHTLWCFFAYIPDGTTKGRLAYVNLPWYTWQAAIDVPGITDPASFTNIGLQTKGDGGLWVFYCTDGEGDPPDGLYVIRYASGWQTPVKITGGTSGHVFFHELYGPSIVIDKDDDYFAYHANINSPYYIRENANSYNYGVMYSGGTGLVHYKYNPTSGSGFFRMLFSRNSKFWYMTRDDDVDWDAYNENAKVEIPSYAMAGTIIGQNSAIDFPPASGDIGLIYKDVAGEYIYFKGLFNEASTSVHAYLEGFSTVSVEYPVLQSAVIVPCAEKAFACASNGNMYCLMQDYNNSNFIQMYKSTDGGQTWATCGSQVTSTTLWGSANMAYLNQMMIAPDNTIHVMVCTSTTSAVCTKWNTYNISTDTWGASWETVYTADGSGNYCYGRLYVDKDGYPWIAACSATNHVVKNRRSGSWSAEEVVGAKLCDWNNWSFAAVDNNKALLATYTVTKIGYYEKQAGTWGSHVDLAYTGGGSGSCSPLGSNSIYMDTSGSWHVYGYNTYNPSLSAGYYLIEDGISLDSFFIDNFGAIYYNNGVAIMLTPEYEHLYDPQPMNRFRKKDGGSWSSKIPTSLKEVSYIFVDYNVNFTNQTSGSFGVLYQLHTATFLWTYYLRANTGVDPPYSHKPAYLLGVLGGSSSIHAFLQAYLTSTDQKLVPDSDIVVGSWKNEASGSVLYPSLADVNVGTYAWYNHANVGDYFEVGLSNPSSTPGTGGHTIVWQAYRKAGTMSMTVKCELRQDTTVIASDEQTITASVATYYKSLTAGEIANITDYNNLRIRITVTAVT